MNNACGQIFGQYPCCNEFLSISFPLTKLGKYKREDCPHCNEKVWHYLSNSNPESWTDKEFLEKFTINYGTQEILEKIKKNDNF